MIKQVLLFSERPEFKALLTYELKVLTGVAPVIHSTLEELESMLEILPVVDVLIVDAPKGKGIIQPFIKRIIARGDSLKNIILMGETEVLEENIKFFIKGDVTTMLDHLKSIVGIPEVVMEGWVSVPISTLQHFSKLPFDLYVKLSDEKYVRRIPCLEEVDFNTINSFIKSGIQELYFEREHKKDFSRMLVNNMLEKINYEYEDANDELKARTEVFHTVKEIVKILGLAPKIIEICDSIVNEITRDVLQSGGELENHIKRLQENSHLAFHYRFIELTCYIGSQLLLALDEKSHATEMRRLIFAAFFCDMTMTDEEQIHHLNLENLKMLKNQGIKEVHDHAWKAANLVSKYRNAPKDIAIVIKQHHGSVDGTGLPLKKSPHVTNMTKCLIIAQELAYGMLTKTQIPALEVLKTMVKKNQGTGLQELAEIFESSLQKD